MKFLALLLTILPVFSQAIEPFPKKATYSAFSPAIAVGTAPTDICKISGSSSKTVYVNRVELTSTQTTAGINNFFLVKRSTDNSAGTMTAMTRVPHDSRSAAAGASVASYTVNPTLGTTVGTVKVWHLLSAAPASVVNSDKGIWSYQEDGAMQPIVLRGTGDVLAINFNGAALPTGLSVDCGFSWNEE